jgi:flagellar hook-associated protein 1 FlgK
MSGGDIFGIGISGLLAAQKALNTVSHNVVNVNTEGYNRQRVELATRDPEFTGSGFFGRGVNVTNVRRSYDDFITQEIRDTTASVKEYERFDSLAGQIDSLLADPQGSLTTAMQGFFNSVQDLANAPASIPARQALLTNADTMVDRFGYFDDRLADSYERVNGELGQLVTEVNSIAQSIADTNRAIVNVQGTRSGSQVANDLLDRRDTLLGKLSELVAVKSVVQDDGTINVFVGTGQVLVNGYVTQTMMLADNEFDSSRKEVALSVGASTLNISDTIRGGTMSAVLDFRDRILDPAKSALGRVAMGLAADFNTQHRLGVDLNGALGGDFFNNDALDPVGTEVLASTNNAGTATVTMTIDDTTQLSTSDYRLSYNGGNRFRLERLSDGTVTNIDASSGYPYTSATIDGFTLTIDSAPVVRDAFLVRPTFGGEQSLRVLVGDASQIAAAGPVRTLNGDANTGAAKIDAGAVVDRAAYVSDNYQVTLGAATAANVSGAAGAITDNNADSALQYQLAVNGVTVYTQAESDPPLADLDALAAAINGSNDANVANTGVKAYVDTGGTTLYFVNVPPKALPVTVTESLATTAGTIEDGDTMTGYFGSALSGLSAASQSVNYLRSADSYIVTDGSDAVVASGAYVEGAPIAFNGIEVSVKGGGNLGDQFAVEPNLGGTGDNRNALALASLQGQNRLEGGTASYGDAYGQLVATVGTRTNQAQINLAAQQVLLDNSLAARSEISGVNLDEEAADMLRYQQLYQATAQVIATGDTLFQSLLGVIRR